MENLSAASRFPSFSGLRRALFSQSLLCEKHSRKNLTILTCSFEMRHNVAGSLDVCPNWTRNPKIWFLMPLINTLYTQFILFEVTIKSFCESTIVNRSLTFKRIFAKAWSKNSFKIKWCAVAMSNFWQYRSLDGTKWEGGAVHSNKVGRLDVDLETSATKNDFSTLFHPLR